MGPFLSKSAMQAEPFNADPDEAQKLRTLFN